MKLGSIVALAVVSLAAAATDFKASEKRAVECCAKIKGPVSVLCSLRATNATMMLAYEGLNTSGLVGPNGMNAEQKDKAKKRLELPLLREMGEINRTGCITNWEDHTDCCTAANIPSDCLHLCDYRELEEWYEEEDVDAIVNRNADIFGRCYQHIEVLSKCSYAA